MLKYFKPKNARKSEEEELEGETPKKKAKETNGEDGPLPSSFLSWNANSFPNRCKEPANIASFAKLVEELDPDIIAIQEVRLTASCPVGAKRGDGQTRNRGRPRDNDKVSREEWMATQRVLDRPPFSRYQVHWSLADWRYAGTATMVKKTLRRPNSVSFNLLGKAGHDENGRICLLEYPDGLMVLNTYAPNNGWKEETSFAKRREWDEMLLQFAETVARDGKRLVWIGDLNVAHKDADVTHPDWFRVQKDKNAPEPHRLDAGQPGFTPNEQSRFTAILNAGKLEDAFREKNASLAGQYDPELPLWTWRGSGHETDRYYARGMRIDYTCVSASMLGRVKRAEILGRGAKREGYRGSDHPPIVLELEREGGGEGGGGEGSQRSPVEEGGMSATAEGGSAEKALRGAAAAHARAAMSAEEARRPASAMVEEEVEGGGEGGATASRGGGDAGEERGREGRGETTSGDEASGRKEEGERGVEERGGAGVRVEWDEKRSEFVARVEGAGQGRREGGGGGGGEEEGGGEVAYLSYVMVKRSGQRAMDMEHTYTPTHMRGRGIAEQLCVAALRHCEAKGYKAIPTCTYIRDRFVPRHPEFKSILLPTR